MRDATMYRIGEGATDILRPFVAREGLATHLDRLTVLFEGGLSGKKFLELLRYYVPWYFSLWKRRPVPHRPDFPHPKVRRKLVYIERQSRKLARTIFYAMLIRGAKMRDDQGRQNRIAIIGEDLFAIAATALHAQRLDQDYAWELADAFFHMAKKRIERHLRALLFNDDAQRARIGESALKGSYSDLSLGIIQRGLTDYLDSKK